MDKVAGIVAEFNPLHNGHKYLISSAGKVSDAVVCVMSGSFVQRGEPAILAKHRRAEAALKSGADLVVELPCPWSLARARDFARGGIFLLKNCLADTIVFGSESGDIKALKKAASAEQNPLFPELLKNELAGGATYAAARTGAMKKIDPKTAEILRQPNNILGTEYIIAAENLNYFPEFITIKRQGVGHDSDSCSSDIASASKIREIFIGDDMDKFVPKQALEIYKKALLQGYVLDREKFETSAGAILRFCGREVFSNLPDISEGLDGALYKACRSSATLTDAAFSAKSKRYTLSRIRRLLCLAALKINADLCRENPPYIRVLGMTDKGAGLLKKIAKTSEMPIVVRPADAKKLNPFAAEVFAAEMRASDMQSLCFKNPLPGGAELTESIVKI